jgi:hypothetical protein
MAVYLDKLGSECKDVHLEGHQKMRVPAAGTRTPSCKVVVLGAVHGAVELPPAAAVGPT